VPAMVVGGVPALYAQGNVSTNFVSVVSTNPAALVAVIIQFLMGFAVGYFGAKALKYIVAFILVLFIGAALSVWSLRGSVEDLMKAFGQLKEVASAVYGLLTTLGIMTVGPVTLGFILGALVALLRK